MFGLSTTPAATSSLLLNLEGVFTAVIAWVVFRENVDLQIFLGMVAIVAGGVAPSWQTAPPAWQLVVSARVSRPLPQELRHVCRPICSLIVSCCPSSATEFRSHAYLTT